MNTLQHQSLMLFALIGLILLTYLTYRGAPLSNENQLTSWTILSISAIAVSAVINSQLGQRSHSVSLELIDTYLLINAFMLGLIIAIGQVLFGLNIQNFANFVSHSAYAVQIFGAIVIFSHMLALISLTDRLRYFMMFIITSMAPVLTLQIVGWRELFPNHPVVFFADLYFVFMLFCGYQLHKIRDESTWLVIRNDNLADHSESQREMAESAKAQLEQEMRDRKAVEFQLQQSNYRLEEKVRERTHDIQQINAHLERSKHSLEMAHNAAGIGSWDWNVAQRSIQTTNFDQILGYTNEEMNDYIGNMSRIIHPEDFQSVRKSITAHLMNRSDRYEAEFRIRHKYGYWVWVQDMGRVIERDPKTRRALRMVGIRRNINAEKTAAEKIKLSATVFQQAAEGIFILDSKLHYMDMNPRFEQITGYHRDDMIGAHVFNHPNVSPRVKQQYLKMLKSLVTHGEYEGEIIDQHKNGDDLPLWIHVNGINDDKNRTTHYIGIISDLTQRKKDEQKLSYLSNYDALTDLPNRNLFKSRLHQLILNTASTKEQFALLRINIDRFRLLNDSLGADGADALLQKVAQRLTSFDSHASLIARLGGDDFAIILENIGASRKEMELYCDALMNTFEQPFQIGAQEVIATLSAGIALFPEHGRQVDTLSNHAEKALQEAKRIGGRALRFFNNDVSIQSIEKVNLENALRKALSNDELTVYYQPKIDVKTQSIDGFEALVRWIHPTKGLISPVQFIPLAEETGLISALGEIVLDKSCAQIKAWELQGFSNIRVSVNIVAQQLQRGNFIETIDRILERHQVDPRWLELEITESSLMDEPDQVKKILNEIKQRHISIALDDFGTGYSSLSYLGQYPIDVLKVDRSFVMEVGVSSSHEAIVRAILAMGHSLGMLVVAEGVETLAHAEFLRDEGCDLLQGYLISKPLPAEQATAFLAQMQRDHSYILG
ncbi:MAG: EAL domain-containing protein, partial [Pseudomonadota bacterium]|nr:EAL domain-containing protein [Pseudomonadota bacterium]